MPQAVELDGPHTCRLDYTPELPLAQMADLEGETKRVLPTVKVLWFPQIPI
jgi:hypothetical protein